MMGGGDEGPPEVATQVPESGTQGWREEGQPGAIDNDDQDPFEAVDCGVSTNEEGEDRPVARRVEVEAQ